MKENIIVNKSFAFAVKIVRLFVSLRERKLYALNGQLVRSGTSIGANVNEATQGQSKKDFISKLSIALKEAYETEYWLKLLYETEIINEDLFNELNTDVIELIRLLTSIIKSSKTNQMSN